MGDVADGTITVLGSGDFVGAKFFGCRVKPHWGQDVCDIESLFIFPLRQGCKSYRIPWGEDDTVQHYEVRCSVLSKAFVESFQSPGASEAAGWTKLMGEVCGALQMPVESAVGGRASHRAGELVTEDTETADNPGSCFLLIDTIPAVMYERSAGAPATTAHRETGVADPSALAADGAFLAVRYLARRNPTIFFRTSSGAFTVSVVAAHWVDLDSKSESTLIEFVYPKAERWLPFRKARSSELHGRVLGRQRGTRVGRDNANPFWVFRKNVREKDETSLAVEYVEIGVNGDGWFHLALALIYVLVLGKYLGEMIHSDHEFFSWGQGVLFIVILLVIFIIGPLATAVLRKVFRRLR